MHAKLSQKDIALDFLSHIIAGKIREAYEKYVSPNFIHHNPYFKGDRESLLLAMEEAHVQFPDKVFIIYRIFESKDSVAVHSSMQLKSGASPIAVVHMFRFEKDHIVEEWEVSQTVPESRVNGNGMF